MKKLKLKLEAILNAVPALSKLANRDLKPAASYAFAKLIKRLNDEVGIFEKTRLDLYKKHGVEKDGGQIELVTPEAKAAVTAGVAELLAVEVEIEFRPIKLSSFVGAVTAGEMVAADQFIEDDLEG